MEKLTQAQEAVLKLKRVYFDEISYDYHANGKECLEYEFNFEKNIEEMQDNCYRICLKANVTDQNHTVELHIQVVGEFECGVEDEVFKDKILNENAIAILFPYLRSQICLVTTQPENVPINIPPINVLSLFA